MNIEERIGVLLGEEEAKKPKPEALERIKQRKKKIADSVKKFQERMKAEKESLKDAIDKQKESKKKESK